jgi:hypothetical protein
MPLAPLQLALAPISFLPQNLSGPHLLASPISPPFAAPTCKIFNCSMIQLLRSLPDLSSLLAILVSRAFILAINRVYCRKIRIGKPFFLQLEEHLTRHYG